MESYQIERKAKFGTTMLKEDEDKQKWSMKNKRRFGRDERRKISSWHSGKLWFRQSTIRWIRTYSKTNKENYGVNTSQIVRESNESRQNRGSRRELRNVRSHEQSNTAKEKMQIFLGSFVVRVSFFWNWGRSFVFGGGVVACIALVNLPRKRRSSPTRPPLQSCFGHVMATLPPAQADRRRGNIVANNAQISVAVRVHFIVYPGFITSLRGPVVNSWIVYGLLSRFSDWFWSFISLIIQDEFRLRSLILFVGLGLASSDEILLGRTPVRLKYCTDVHYTASIVVENNIFCIYPGVWLSTTVIIHCSETVF